MEKDYLPIGTVVLLTGATKRVMITGYLVASVNNENIIYDYSGCLFPEGIISNDRNLVFNHNQIKKIHYMGLEDDEQKKFINKLLEFNKNDNN